MPVHAATISATTWPSTCSGTIGSPPCSACSAATRSASLSRVACTSTGWPSSDGPRVVERFAQFGDLGDDHALGFIARFVLRQLLERRVARAAQLAEPLVVRCAARCLALQRRDLRVDPLDALLRVVDRRRRRAVRECDLRARGVEHADRLVRQLAAADVAMRQAHGLGDRVVEDPHVEVLLHQAGHPAQHRGRERLARLFDLHDLEAPRERRVLLEVLLVFAPRRRGDRAQLAARERRLQQVRRVVLAGLAARADDRVRLVDEQDDRMRALLHLVDHALQAVLELALHARAGLQQPHVEHVQRDATQRRRHVVGRDAQREPSTTAVLPTPASPVMIGLFWRRRIRMSIAWRISASRPITGSILPSRARCVRLVVYVSSAGVFDGPAAGAGRRRPARRRCLRRPPDAARLRSSRP